MTEYGVIHGIPNPPHHRPDQKFCDECKGAWFITMRVQQLQTHPVLIGEEGLRLDPSFFLYECVACGHITPPPTAYTGLSGEQKIYEELLRIVDDANKRDENRKCTCPTQEVYGQ